jgi:HK97 family phage major capsid protein
MDRIKALRAQRKELQTQIEAIFAEAAKRAEGESDETKAAELRALTDDEEAAAAAKRAEIRTIDERIVELAEGEEAARRAAEAALRLGLNDDPEADPDGTRVTSEPHTYRKGGEHGYFVDLFRAQMRGDDEARARLRRHGQEALDDLRKREKEGRELPGLERRDLDRVDGSGGQFVPPIYLVEQYIPLARAARPTADLVQNLPLPPGTDSINIPKVATGTATAPQTADNAAVTETDLTDANINAAVKTIAGQQDVAIQLLDQSPIAFDQVIFADLMADYATKVDVQVLKGSNASGQVKGILQSATGQVAVTYTDASPTVPELYPKVADAIQQIHTGRFLPPTVIVMHPRRWGWMLAALDGQNRPLVVPRAQMPQNAFAAMGDVVAERVVGELQGLPVVTDSSVPTNLGSGTNEDRIIIFRASDSYLWESSIRSRVLPEVGSGTLTVRLQVYGYLAFTCDRYQSGIAVISGTGLATPTF